MEISTILTADILDILFDGRNKEYGAYDLRRTYRRRLMLSITVMLSVICMLCIGFAFAGKKTQLAKDFIIPPDVVLEAAKPEEKPVEPPPPPPMKPPAPPVQVQMKQFTPPRIVPEDQVAEDEKPPVNSDLEDFKIGTANKDGETDGGLVIAPPGEAPGTGVIDIKKNDEDPDGLFISVQIESEYPGGMAAWQRFLNRSLRYPQEAVDQGIEGFVTVQFIVDKEGNVSNVEAVSGPQELRAEAVRVIKKSGKWTPAVQNGRQVKSYKKQPIGFRIAAE
jgi:periplasmic protein TonB